MSPTNQPLVAVCLWLLAVWTTVHSFEFSFRSNEACATSGYATNSVPDSFLAFHASPRCTNAFYDLGLTNQRELHQSYESKHGMNVPAPEPAGSWFTPLNDSVWHVLKLVGEAIAAHNFDSDHFASAAAFQHQLQLSTMSTNPTTPAAGGGGGM